ncbi:hypothetical protein ABZ726_37630, partial [Streptomyces hundungensis]
MCVSAPGVVDGEAAGGGGEEGGAGGETGGGAGTERVGDAAGFEGAPIQLVLTKGRAGEVYNVGGGNEQTNRQITERL